MADGQHLKPAMCGIPQLPSLQPNRPPKVNRGMRVEEVSSLVCEPHSFAAASGFTLGSMNHDGDVRGRNVWSEV